MAEQDDPKVRGRGIAATALAVLVGSLGVVAGPAVPADADSPPTAAGNVIHGFRLDGDGAFHVVDHPDAGTTPSDPITGGTGTSTVGINDRGEMVGLYADRSDVIRAFLRSRDGRYTVIDPPDSFPNEELADINNRGEIVGFADEDGDNTAGTRGFLRTRRGRYEAIEVPDAASTVAFKVNDRSQVAGVWFTRNLPGAAPQVHGFVWDGGDVTTIDHPDAVYGTYVFGINNRGDTVGWYYDADDRARGFLRDRQGRFTAIDVPGAERGTVVASVNDRGEMVGGVVNADLSSDGFHRSRNGRVTMIEAPDEATYTRALDISNQGDIVGDYDAEPPGTDNGDPR